VLSSQVAVTTNITDLGEFLQHIITHTNMTCLNAADDALVSSSVHSSLYTVASLTPLPCPCVSPQSLEGSNFLAANLYARSVFGEDALVNVSVEKKEDADGKISGYIRIRSKTQGIALSLGDRITAVQRSADVESAKKNGHL
jgi:coatomer subunit beta